MEQKFCILALAEEKKTDRSLSFMTHIEEPWPQRNKDTLFWRTTLLSLKNMINRVHHSFIDIELVPKLLRAHINRYT